MNWWILLFPILSALIGFFLSLLAIKIFFNPLRFQKKQNAFAKKLEAIINTDILSQTLIEQKITDPDSFKKLIPLIEAHIDEFLRVTLTKEMPYITAFIGDKTIDSLKKIFMQELETLFPEVIKTYAVNLVSELEPEKLISQKIAGLPKNKIRFLLENQIYDVKLFGTFIGLIIGIVQSAIILALNV